MIERLNITYQKKPCYDIVFTDTFQALSSELQAMQLSCSKIAIITDTNVFELYAQEVKSLLCDTYKNVSIYTIPAGEENKNLDTVKDIYTYLIQENFTRKDLLIALGGGVVGDITGYVAATYMRGMDFVQIPTTLLAQTDSSIGGKTGVDFDGFKNMIGAFKMPRLVYSNVSVLNSLDERQYYSGFAEVMKYGLIKDSHFYEWLLENMYEISDKENNTLIYMIKKSCEIKKIIVEKDPMEFGERVLLNFGHTIGHALEKAKNFKYLHGECVALGCVAAAFISWKKEYLSMDEYYEIRDMFVPFHLPISIDGISPREVLSFTKSDKKMDNTTIQFILLKKIGKAIIDKTVTDQEIIDAINEIHFSEEDAHE